MPAISKIRLTNIKYENGNKQINDEIYHFDGHNGAIILENGGGKTVLIHTVLQAVLPHTNLGERKIRDTLQLENSPAHIGIEWIINDHPRRYVTTAVSLFLQNNTLQSYRYVFDYEEGHSDRLEKIPFAIETENGKRPAYKEEMADYFQAMKRQTSNAQTFDTLYEFHNYIENNFQIIHSEWKSIVKINGDEGGIERFFEHCRTTTDLYDRLLIPIVEDSIERYEKGMFADLFEQQREGFQAYLHFKKSIEEHKMIQQELGSYVKEFALYDKLNINYETVRRKAKGLYETIIEQQVLITTELTDNEALFKKWNEDEYLLTIKQLSYDILQEREKRDHLQQQFTKKQIEVNETETKLTQAERDLYSLHHAKLMDKQQTTEQLIKEYEKRLEEYDAESDIDDYETALEQENEKLHGYFMTKIERTDKEIKHLQQEKMPIKTLIEQLVEKVDKKKVNLSEQKKAFYQLDGEIKSKKDSLIRLEQLLLANPNQQNVIDELKKWNKQFESLDYEMIELTQNKKKSNKKLAQLTEKIAEKEIEQTNIKLLLQETEYKLESINEAHDLLVEQLGTVRKNWQTVDLYLRHDSIYHSLVNLQKNITTERERYLYEERLAYRFIDDYEQQQSFFADSFLAERIESWQSNFPIHIGTDYYNNLPEEEKHVYKDYPLWSITLITIESEKAKLIDKVTEVKDRLQFPVIILSLEDIKDMQELENEKWITPDHWQYNIDDDHFYNWKETIRQLAEDVTEKRLKKEKELRQIERVIEQFEGFFQQFPKTYKESLHQKRVEQKECKKENERDLTITIEKKREKEQTLTKIDELIMECQEQLNGYERRISQANEYLQINYDVKELTKQSQRIKSEITLLKEKIDHLKKELKRANEEKQFIIDRMREVESQRRFIKQTDLYNKVKQHKPVFTNETKDIIEERRTQLQNAIAGIRHSYEEIETRIHYETEKLIEYNNKIKNLRQKYLIDKELVFPTDGDYLMGQLEQLIQQYERQKVILLDNQATIKTKLDQRIALVNKGEEDFYTDYPNESLQTFTVPLDDVPKILKEENETLIKRKQYLEREKSRLTSEQEDINDVKHELEKYVIKHQFDSTLIEAIQLTEEAKTKFSYNRKHDVQTLIEQLNDANDELLNGEEQLSKSKQLFQNFCRRHISDYEMRERALEGIEQQKTYDDILTFQEKMNQKIESANLYARNYIRDKDKEVQAFIDNLHNHLVNVTDQLRHIPRKTRVTVGERRREIFSFTIPDWEEQEGKSRISDYLDWILEQLELDHYKNEQGLEDESKVRQQIEIWFDTRQLLQVVMKEKSMNVLCRKVTNDNEVTSRLTSWEESNKWSGGEKWSKNMTLFLGILNYVAEKKQFNVNVKRQQAVILDNPFGKASSEHVLSPVFFIAEQLGFQMIALTAHAEGKFIQDYFPINYSCRLRSADDGETQIMTKEKRLQHAFFHDHHPKSLDRLGGQEKLSLI